MIEKLTPITYTQGGVLDKINELIEQSNRQDEAIIELSEMMFDSEDTTYGFYNLTAPEIIRKILSEPIRKKDL